VFAADKTLASKGSGVFVRFRAAWTAVYAPRLEYHSCRSVLVANLDRR
jgi:hypothetical protein